MRIQEFNYGVDLLVALLWEYNQAIRLQTILEKKQTWYDENQTDFWEDWYNNVFNLQTANDFGCSVWSIILNLPLYIGSPPDPTDKPIWGFGAFNQNFEHGNFSTNNAGFGLTTDQKRLILKLRYFQLITRGAIPEINRFMKFIFGDLGAVYVLDGLDMTMTYVFTFNLDDRILDMIRAYDLLPRPAAVGLKIVFATDFIWGFEEFNENFENGNFIGDF